MKSLRKIIVLTLAVAVLVTAGLLESFNLLAAKHRGQVKQELQKVLGQDVTFDRLEVNLLGRPGFSAKDFRIADDPRFAATPVVRARELVLGVSLWDLLWWRRLVITSLTFDEPEFQIITDESGLLNLTALVNRKTQLRKFPRLRPPGPPEQRHPVSFAIDEIRIRQGRVDYVDRSVKRPAELRIGNVTMSVRGFELDEATEIHIAASLTEGLGQDVRIEGRLTPPGENHTWLQRGVDLSVQFDSLHVPVVARAIAALRDKIPNELDVTGPMALQAQVRGTPERPRLENLTLKIPLFGSSEYNAIVNGAVHFTKRRSWEDAELQGNATVKPLPLGRLRRIEAFAQILPPALISEGTVNIYSRFEGTWRNLRLGALVRADDADLRYKGWIHKPAEAPATIRARISREKHRLRFHESELVLGANKMIFSGSIDHGLAPRLQVKLRNQAGSVPAWGRFFTLPKFEALAGKVDVDVTIAKSLVPDNDDWSLAGRLKLTDTALRHKASNRSVDNLRAEIAFAGKTARLENVRFRLGSSLIFLDGTAAHVLEPRLLGSLRSPDLLLADLPVLGTSPLVRLKNVSGAGEFYFENNQWMIKAAVTSARGDLNELPFRDLRADIALSPAGLTFKNLWAQMLDGRLQSDGQWAEDAANGPQLEFSSRIDAVQMRALLAQVFPALKDRVEGQLNGQGQFQVNSMDSAGMKEALKGFGEVSVKQGVLKDFNLIGQLLLKGSGATVSAASTARLSRGFAALASRPDTLFESLTADFTIDQKRVFSENLVITTPDYTITATGWIGFDRSTKWNGSLVLSERLTQEAQRDYRIIRYLLDRRGRLAISFRVDGKIPKVDVRLENRALAQALRSGASQEDSTRDGQSVEASKSDKNWLPDALERFLNR
ncbi:MAG: AsmA-like C-terminal region-containing protein [Gammaproteobacteria bacterium]